MPDAYSLVQGASFEWASLTGNLSPERLDRLKKHSIKGKLLDAGCAGGAYAKYFSQNGALVTGVDSHDCFLAHAIQYSSATCNFACADIQRLPFRDKSFDFSLCFDVLEHVDDDRVALAELIRVTRKKVFIAIPQEDRLLPEFGLTLAPYRDSTHLRYYTSSRLEELIRSVKVSDFEIHNEGRVPLEELFRRTITRGKPLRSFHDYHRFKLGGSLARKLTSLLIATLLDLEKFDLDTRRYVTSSAVFSDIYQGLFAILNVPES